MTTTHRRPPWHAQTIQDAAFETFRCQARAIEALRRNDPGNIGARFSYKALAARTKGTVHGFQIQASNPDFQLIHFRVRFSAAR